MSQEQSAMKVNWLERAKETHRFHSRKKRGGKWRIQDTAKALKRSLGSICEDLLIASWYKTHPDKIERFDYAKDALDWIRNKESELELGDLE